MGQCLCGSGALEDRAVPVSPSTISPNTAVPSLTKRAGGLLDVPQGRCRLVGFVLGQGEQVAELRAQDGYLKKTPGDDMYLRVFVNSHKWVMTLGPEGIDTRSQGITQVWAKLEARREEQEEGEEGEDAVFEGMSEACELRVLEDGIAVIEGLVIYARPLGVPARIECSLSWRVNKPVEMEQQTKPEEEEEETHSPLQRTLPNISIQVN
jgi:hypothetical protein